MATLNLVISALVAQVARATCNLTDSSGQPFQVKVARDTPSERAISDTARGLYAAIGIIDRKVGRAITQWGPRKIGGSVTAATLTSSFAASGAVLSKVTLTPGGTATLALGGSVTAGDGLSLCADQPLTRPQTAAQVVTSAAPATPAGYAAQLARQVAADPVLSALLSAAASGNDVLITSVAAAPLVLQSFTGNGGSSIRELTRTQRQIQLYIWAGNDDQRNVIGTAIEALFAQIEMYDGPFYMGLPLSTGEAAQLINGNNFDVDDAVMSNSYRRDFLFGVEYSVTTTDALWSVLVVSQSFQPST